MKTGILIYVYYYYLWVFCDNELTYVQTQKPRNVRVGHRLTNLDEKMTRPWNFPEGNFLRIYHLLDFLQKLSKTVLQLRILQFFFKISTHFN